MSVDNDLLFNSNGAHYTVAVVHLFDDDVIRNLLYSGTSYQSFFQKPDWLTSDYTLHSCWVGLTAKRKYGEVVHLVFQ